MTSSKSPNISSLKALLSSNQAAGALFKAFSGRERTRRDSSVARTQVLLKNDYKISLGSKDIGAMFQEFENLGLGKCVTKRNKVRRFVWGYNIIDLGKAVSGENVKIEPIDVAAYKEAPKRQQKPKIAKFKLKLAPVIEETTENEAIIKRFIVRRAGYEVQVPVNMTPAEVKQTTEFVRNLTA